MRVSPHPGSGTTGVHRVLVLGAGYAGAMAVNRTLASLTPAEAEHVEVTVVNPRVDFIERIRLHQLAAGTILSAGRPLEKVLHPAARLLSGTAELIDSAGRCVRVRTDGGVHDLPYDTLVYAVGSRAAAQAPGAAAHAYLLADLEGAEAARRGLAALAPGARVAVVGGGLTGVESAAEVAERRPDLAVLLVSADRIVGRMSPRARSRILRRLGRLGVEVRELAPVRRVGDGVLEVDGAPPVLFDACLWAASFGVPDLAARSGLATDELGRLRVRADLTAVGAPDVVGAGDAVVVDGDAGRHLRMGCAAALPLGGHAARTVLARLRGEPTAPASIGYLVQCVSLGRGEGVIEVVHADDSPRGLVIAGRVGALLKEAVCRFAMAAPLNERSRPGSYRVPRGPRPVATPSRVPVP
jgi:NADH dehydrogenase FAD-containing subunit